MWNQLFVYIIIIFFDSVKNVQDLEETKQNLNKQIETLESQKHQIKTDLEAGQFELKQSQSEVRNLQTSRDELQEQLETKIGEYIQSIDELEQDLKTKKTEHDSLQEQLVQLLEKLTSTGKGYMYDYFLQLNFLSYNSWYLRSFVHSGPENLKKCRKKLVKPNKPNK